MFYSLETHTPTPDGIRLGTFVFEEAADVVLPAVGDYVLMDGMPGPARVVRRTFKYARDSRSDAVRKGLTITLVCAELGK